MRTVNEASVWKHEILDAAAMLFWVLLAACKAAGEKSVTVKERMIRTILVLHVDTEQMGRRDDTAAS